MFSTRHFLLAQTHTFPHTTRVAGAPGWLWVWVPAWKVLWLMVHFNTGPICRISPAMHMCEWLWRKDPQPGHASLMSGTQRLCLARVNSRAQSLWSHGVFTCLSQSEAAEPTSDYPCQGNAPYIVRATDGTLVKGPSSTFESSEGSWCFTFERGV